MGRHTGGSCPGQRGHVPLHERSPQAAKFNPGMDLWLGLESYLQDNAADHGRRLVVFTGRIFSDTDPIYRTCRFR